MADHNSMDSLVLKLGDALLSGDLMPWLGAAASAFGATKMSLMPLTGTAWQPVNCAFGWSEDQAESYLEYYHRLDILTLRMRKMKDMTAHRMEDVLSEQEVRQSEISNDFWAPAEVTYALCVPIDIGPSMRVVLGCARPADTSNFSARDTTDLTRLAQYVRQFIRISLHFQDTGASARTLGWTIDQLSVPTFLINSSYRIVFSNKAASELISTKDSLIYKRDSGIGSADTKINSNLRNAISGVLSGELLQAVIPLNQRSGAGPRTAIVMRPPSDELSVLPVSVKEPQAIVFVIKHEPSKAPPMPGFLASVFGFTQKEAAVASLLASGENLESIARRLSVSREGIRYHLKQLFLKTGTHGQREFVQLITAGEGMLNSSLGQGSG